MNDRPVCDVVIVNWNSGPLLAQCLKSLVATRTIDFRFGTVVVVDNASTDGSGDVELPSGLPMRLVRNAANEGFARACNRGAASGRGSHLLFLNPDTVLPPECIDGLFAWMSAHPEFTRSIVGIRLVDADGRTSVTCSRFPDLRSVVVKTFGAERVLARFGWSQPMLEFDHRQSRVVDQVMGAFFLVPRSLFAELRGFAEEYFLYYEEVDFSRRARRLGWNSVFCAEVSAMHVGGGSTSKAPTRNLFLNLRSRLIYCRANFSVPAFLAAAFLITGVEPITRLVQAVIKRRWRAIGHILRAYGLLYADLFFRSGRMSR